MAALIADFTRTFPSGASVSARFSLEMPGGAIAVLFGPSGAGKTTIVRAIAGLERPGRGRIAFGDEVWFADDGSWQPPQRRRVGLVSQEPALFPHLSVRRNVAYGLGRASPSERRERVDRMLALVDLAGFDARKPHELSGGQAQRAALARALASAPRLLLLDEPFGALDAPSRARLRRDLRAIVRSAHAAALFVTHDRAEAIALGDQLIVVADGGVRQVGPVLDVFRRPADLVVARTVGVESVLPATVMRIDRGLVDLQVGGATLHAADVGLDGEQDQVFACVRAEDVTLLQQASPGASARNHLPGRIAAIEPEGGVERITIDCGFPLVALITRNAREELALAEGTPIVAAVKATAVHLIPRA